MAIPSSIKQQVEAQILRALATYFSEAEEHEDDDVRIGSVEERVSDFYLYIASGDGSSTPAPAATAPAETITEPGKMTYEQLLDWAKTQHGKTERDLLIWFALADVDGFRELTDQDFAEQLVDGITYDSSRIKGYWDSLDAAEQHDYRDVYMFQAWIG